MTGFIGFVTLVIAATVLASASASAAATAAEKRRAVAAHRAAAIDYARRNDDDAARAHSRDPAGDYKAYPNWARAALGSGGPARGGR
jgi:Ni/Co efflux regulator RcnB